MCGTVAKCSCVEFGWPEMAFCIIGCPHTFAGNSHKVAVRGSRRDRPQSPILYADMLLELNRPADALKQYSLSLK
jgi:hypothetical protein